MTGGLTPNSSDFTRKVAGTFHVPSPILRLTEHGMCLLLSKVSAIGLIPPRSSNELLRFGIVVLLRGNVAACSDL